MNDVVAFSSDGGVGRKRMVRKGQKCEIVEMCGTHVDGGMARVWRERKGGMKVMKKKSSSRLIVSKLAIEEIRGCWRLCS